MHLFWGLIEAAAKEASNQNGSTWTGWAVTSLTSRFYQSGGPNQQQPANENKQNSKKPANEKTGNKPAQPQAKG